MLCKTARVGTIQVKVHNSAVRTLTALRHVPEMKKNLLSLVNSNRCKYRALGGVLSVMKGGPVVSKGMKVSSLICFRITQLQVLQCVLSEDSDSDMVFGKKSFLYSQRIRKLDFE